MRKQSQLRVREARQVCVLIVQQRRRADHIRRHNVREQLLDEPVTTAEYEAAKEAWMAGK